MGEKSMERNPDIEWEEFNTNYVKLETGVARKLKLTNWRQRMWFNKPGLGFDVLAEDAAPTTKTFTTTSKRLIQALRPIIQKAEEKGSKVILVSILRTGEGMDTSYEVREDA